MSNPSPVAIIFLKAPRQGNVKTRLAGELGMERACAVYRQLVDTVVANLEPLPRVQLRFSPDDAADEIRPWLRPTWTLRPQGEGDLGSRLIRAFEEPFAEGADRVVVVGSDCPEVSAEDVHQAWRALGQFDLVLGPAVDGGYWLIGLNRSMPSLFNGVPWSTEQVLAVTLKRAKAAGLRTLLLRILQDVDTAQDWKAYEDTRQGGF